MAVKCERASEITDYLKGETAPQERETLRVHFEACAHCSAELGRFDRVLKALGKLETVDPSPGFKWRVREAFLRSLPEDRRLLLQQRRVRGVR
ncbi:MAG TPA: zf-HC2 domain-containing protein, partial [Planctomycetota bacterium]|nr:zf-HC2 domain-containing protein [Planctomycetota bacterium]